MDRLVILRRRYPDDDRLRRLCADDVPNKIDYNILWTQWRDPLVDDV